MRIPAMIRTIYLFLLIGLSHIISAQLTDSLHKKKPAKKFRLGIELGRSPRNLYYLTGPDNYVKSYPYYKVSVGYNLSLGRNNYLLLALGIAGEQSYSSIRENSTTEFYSPDTINATPVIAHTFTRRYWAGYYKTKTTFCTIDIGFQKIYSPFKNEKLKSVFMFMLSGKPVVYKESKTTNTYTKDSITREQTYEILSTRYEYGSKSKVKIAGPVDLLFSFSPGLLYEQKHVQHHVGINFSAQYIFPNGRSLIRSSNFIRLVYYLCF